MTPILPRFRGFLQGASSVWWGLACAIVVAGLVSIALRQDSNWDLQNYHLYNAWAFVHGRLGIDWAPAQLQTYHSPFLDLPFYAMLAYDLPPRWIAFALAIPTGCAWFFLVRIVLRLLQHTDATLRTPAIATAIAIGVTAPMPISLIGLTMNDWYTAAFALAAVWIVVRGATSAASADRALLAAGALVGVGAGLKLTGSIYAVGLVAGVLALGTAWPQRVRAACLTAGAAAAAFALSAGPWMLVLYRKFGNPLFPYFNNVFRSPWTDPVALAPSGFGPATAAEWMAFPYMLLWKLEGFVAEPEFRDARPALLYTLAIVAAGGAVLKLRANSSTRTGQVPGADRAAWRFVVTFFVVSCAAWAIVYRIWRYLLPLELLAGALIVALLLRLVPRHAAQFALAAALVLVIVTARFPTWWRERFGEHFLTVAMPDVRPNSLVLLVSGEPMAYVLPSFPADARFAGLANNLNDPGRDNLLQQSIATTVRDHRGPLYSLAAPAGRDVGSAPLAQMGLARSACALIRTNLRVSPLELCELRRT